MSKKRKTEASSSTTAVEMVVSEAQLTTTTSMMETAEPAPQAKSSGSGILLKVALGLCVVLNMAFAGFGVYLLVENQKLQEENLSLADAKLERKDQIREMVSEVNQMRDQFLAFQEQNRRIKNMLGVNEEPAIGGPENTDVYTYVYRVNERELMSRLRNDLEEIEEGLETEDEMQGALERYLLERQELLNVLPSVNPAPDGWVTSGFQLRRDPFTNEYRMHKGLDLACTYRCDIFSTAAGVVVGAERQSGYGKLITIDHGHGIVSRYAHLSRMLVEVGDKIERGQLIGKMGMSGRATGIHLHYEVLYNGEHVDPAYFILNL